MAALPPGLDFTGATVTEGGFKTALTSMRDFLAGLLGTTGTPADARLALGVLADVAEVTVASASTTNLGAAASSNVLVSGAVTITSFGSVAAGTVRNVRFSGAPLVTHNASMLILPGGANIQAAAGDCLSAESLGSGAWVVRAYTRADGKAVTAPVTVTSAFVQTFLTNGTWTKPTGLTGYERVIIEAWGGGGGGGAGGSGGGGAYVRRELPLSAMGATETVTIGAGGAINTAGGNTTVGSLVTAYGGGGGGGSNSYGGGGGGGWYGAGATVSTGGGALGGAGYTGPTAIGSQAVIDAGGCGLNTTGKGYGSFYGGGGGVNGSGAGVGGSSTFGGAGGGTNGYPGISLFGGNGGTGLVAGSVPGGGGGTNFSTGGTEGASGKVIITIC